MNTKNLDAIKRMVTRLQAISETEWMILDVAVRINSAKELLKEAVDMYESPNKENPTEVRTD